MKSFRSKKRIFMVAAIALLVVFLALAGAPREVQGQMGNQAEFNQGQPEAPVDTGFIYQGQLKDGGNPANGQYDFQFRLCDADSGGTQVGSLLTILNLSVANGLFSTRLNFGAGPYFGQNRWLEIAVRAAGGGSYTTLSPRQPLTATPYAAGLVPGTIVTGTVASTFAAYNTLMNGNGLYGDASTGFGHGVYGVSIQGRGVRGDTVSGDGVLGISSAGGLGVRGTSVDSFGVSGISTNNYGVRGGGTSGILGVANASNGTGVTGQSPGGLGVSGTTGGGATVSGVSGTSTGANGVGVAGLATNGTVALGVWGSTTGGRGVYGSANTGVGVYGASNSGWAGYFLGNVEVTGACCAAGEAYTQIDHPLDPRHKYLNQSLVQSPDLLTTINGNAILDAKGETVVALPDWFEAANSDFRYQFAPIGAPMPNLYIAQKVEYSRFRIAGGKPGGEVSWQVTGIRHDSYALAHPLQVEAEKPADEQGKYRHPTEWGQPESMGIDYGQNPSMQPPVLAP